MNYSPAKKLQKIFKFWGWELMIGCLFLALYGPLIWHWFQGWLNKSIGLEHDYFNHGLIGLPFAAYLIYLNRKQWQRLPDKSQGMGGILLLISGGLYLTNLDDLVNLSLPLMLAGLCLWLKGVPGLKLQKMPWVFISLATPHHLPYLIEPLALPLQKFITATAGFILNCVGVDVVIQQIYLSVDNRIVEVAAHCAGLKMLFTSLYVALMLLYWTEVGRDRWKTICFLMMTVLISISGNIFRNTLLTFFYFHHQDRLFEWLHEGWGGDVYSAGILGLLVVIINQLESGAGNYPEGAGESATVNEFNEQ